MADQLLYENERRTKDVDVSMPRSDDRQLSFDHVLGPSTAIKEARFHVRDGDADTGTVVIALSMEENPTQWDFSTDNIGIITIDTTDTTGVDLGSYSYAIELVDYDDTVYTPQRGKFELSDDVVANTGSAPYLSWSTRNDIDTSIDALTSSFAQLATAGNCTWITVALSGGESEITVYDASFLAATNDIRIVLDSGYDDDVIDSIDGSTITLTGTVSGAASQYNIVRVL